MMLVPQGSCLGINSTRKSNSLLLTSRRLPTYPVNQETDNNDNIFKRVRGAATVPMLSQGSLEKKGVSPACEIPSLTT